MKRDSSRHKKSRLVFQGLSFLHQSQLGVHGTLKSSNCLIDSRWVCKVCDFGLDKFKQNQVSETDVSESAKFRSEWII